MSALRSGRPTRLKRVWVTPGGEGDVVRRRLLFVIAALTMILSVFAPLASAGDVAASDFTVDTDGISLDSVYTRAAVVDRNGQKLVSVIVKLESDSLASYRGGLSGLPATSPSVTGDAKLDVDSLNARRYRAHLGREFDAFERTPQSSASGFRGHPSLRPHRRRSLRSRSDR